MPCNFGLHPGHFEYYARILWALFNSLETVAIFCFSRQLNWLFSDCKFWQALCELWSQCHFLHQFLCNIICVWRKWQPTPVFLPGESDMTEWLHFTSLQCVSFPGGSDGEESACNAGDLGLIPGLGRSPGERNGYPLQYSCLQSSKDRGAWWTTIPGIAKSQTGLSDFTICGHHVAILTYGLWSISVQFSKLMECSFLSKLYMDLLGVYPIVKD